jgi:hypothetical protein
MKYKDDDQEEAIIDKGYEMQPLLHKGWLGWRGKNIIL